MFSNFGAEKPPHRKAAKHYQPFLTNIMAIIKKVKNMYITARGIHTVLQVLYNRNS